MFGSWIVQNVDVYRVQRRINDNLKQQHPLHKTFPLIFTVSMHLHPHVTTRHTARPEGDVATEQMAPKVQAPRAERQHTRRSPACTASPNTRLVLHPLKHRSRCEQKRQNWPKHWVDLHEHQQDAEPVQVVPHVRLMLILHQTPVPNRGHHCEAKRARKKQLPVPQCRHQRQRHPNARVAKHSRARRRDHASTCPTRAQVPQPKPQTLRTQPALRYHPYS